MLVAQGIIPTYVPKFEDVESPLQPVDETTEERRRRLLVCRSVISFIDSNLTAFSLLYKAQQEEVQRELKELEEIRRLRVSLDKVYI